MDVAIIALPPRREERSRVAAVLAAEQLRRVTETADAPAAAAAEPAPALRLSTTISLLA